MASLLARDIGYRSLLGFAAPTVLSYCLINIYFIIDGIFVARAIGTAGLAAVNIAMPILGVTLALATMVGTGGSAWVAAELGRQRHEEARQDFSLLVLACTVGSAVLGALGLCFLDGVLALLGADGALLPLCRDYAVPLLLSSPFVMGGMVLDTFLIAEGQPRLALASSFLGGFLNVTLDYVFLFLLGMGIEGAAIATAIGYSASALVALSYFGIRRRGTLRLVRPAWRWLPIRRSLANGMSEMVTMLAMSLLLLVTNHTMMRLAGEEGVAAISIVQYAEELLSAIYIGYAEGVAPLTSFNFGAKNYERLQRIYRCSLRIIACFAVFAFLFGLALAAPMAAAFAGENAAVCRMAAHGFRIFAVGFLFVGFNIYASSLFTALNDGKTSALLSFCHTLVFLVGMMLVLPRLLALDGVWLAHPIGEFLALLLSFSFFRRKGVPQWNA